MIHHRLDYIVRDSKASFGTSPGGFDIERIIKSARVLRRNGDPNATEICFEMKVALDINQVYTKRADLHRQLYQHRVVNVCEAMITDLLTNRKLTAATDVVISGCSAGGLATFLHCDHWAAAIGKVCCAVLVLCLCCAVLCGDVC